MYHKRALAIDTALVACVREGSGTLIGFRERSWICLVTTMYRYRACLRPLWAVCVRLESDSARQISSLLPGPYRAAKAGAHDPCRRREMRCECLN